MGNYDFDKRRTIRTYSDRPLNLEVLEGILDDAMRAPTCGNMQLYSVVVTRSPEGKDALAPLHFNQPMVRNAQAVLTVCADFYRFTRWCELSNAEPGYDNLLSFFEAFQDAQIYAQQICTIAESRGLGTCYLGTVLYNADKISELLRLPELCVPVACITIGYPADDGVETERLPLRAVMHEESYRAHSDEEILNYFKAKDDFEPNREYVKENNKQTLAQVFTDIRYRGDLNRQVSEMLEKLLKEKKYL